MPNDHETILKTEVKICSWVKLLKIILKTQRNLMFAEYCLPLFHLHDISGIHL